ncbi:MAG: hypothetical protein AAF663_01710 [Planctomycetota bacterium]
MTRQAICLAAAAGFASPALAQFRVFGDQAAWEAAVAAAGGTPVVETFAGITSGDLTPATGPFVVNPDFSIEVTGGPGNAGDAFIANGTFHGELFPDDPRLHESYIHRFENPVFAFGQNLNGAASGRGVRISTSQGAADVLDFIPQRTFGDGFLGFVSSTPVREVTLIGSDADGADFLGEIYDADDARYAFGDLNFFDSTLDFRVQAVQESGSVGAIAGSSVSLDITPGPASKCPPPPRSATPTPSADRPATR